MLMLTNANKWAMASRNRIFCTTFALYRKKNAIRNNSTKEV